MHIHARICQEPHITLAHPRKPGAVGNLDASLALMPKSFILVFARISLIEQTGATPWRTLADAPICSV